MRSSTVLHVYKNLSESRTESILLKTTAATQVFQLMSHCQQCPPTKYEDDCFIFRVSLCYQARSNKKNVIYLCVTFPARMRIEPSCLAVFTHSMMFASVNQLHVHCVRSFYKKKVKELGKTAKKAILNSASKMLKLNPKLITDNYVY